jgi:hypothetical protein
MTSGLTSFNQALCWGVRFGGEGSPLTGSLEGVSPFSSASTVFHTATKGGSGSAVNDGYPLKLVHGTTKRTQTNCPHSYPQPVDRDSRRRSVVYRRGRRGVWARHSGTALCGLATCSGVLASLSGRRPDVGTALPEANSFLRECQPFCNIARGRLFGNGRPVTAVTDVNISRDAGGGLT